MLYICTHALLLLHVFQGAEWTPLLLASHANQTDVMELLIQHGAQLDTINKVHCMGCRAIV